MIPNPKMYHQVSEKQSDNISEEKISIVRKSHFDIDSGISRSKKKKGVIAYSVILHVKLVLTSCLKCVASIISILSSFSCFSSHSPPDLTGLCACSIILLPPFSPTPPPQCSSSWGFPPDPGGLGPGGSKKVTLLSQTKSQWCQRPKKSTTTGLDYEDISNARVS